MRKTRIAFLGFGGIAGAHAPGFAAMADQCEVVAVAEPAARNVERARKAFGEGIRVYDDYRKLLASEQVDGVDIVLPHHLHMPATVAAAEAGCHVLVEKVMARNIAECDMMIEACDKAGVILLVSHDRRYAGPWVAMKRVLETGVLGRIFYWKLEHNQNVAFPPGHWAFSKDGIGGGAIMSCLTHQIDALRWYEGEVASVTAMSQVDPARMEGEFAGVLVAKTRSDALVNMSINWWTRSNGVSWTATGEKREDTFNGLWYEMNQCCGTKGEAYFMYGKGTFVKLHEKPDREVTLFDADDALKRFTPVPWPEERGHVGCIRQWIRAIRGEPAELLTTGRDCRGTVEVAQAAYQSIETGRAVALPLA